MLAAGSETTRPFFVVAQKTCSQLGDALYSEGHKTPDCLPQIINEGQWRFPLQYSDSVKSSASQLRDTKLSLVPREAAKPPWQSFAQPICLIQICRTTA